MANRWIRFLLAVLAIAAASAAVYRVVGNEQRIAQHNSSARKAAFAADVALSSVEELKSVLHAYVAPGQGTDLWTARARLALDKLRGALLDLDAQVAGPDSSVAEALDACDRLSAAEQRAQGYVRDKQALLAGEIIFTEARDLLDSMRIQVARTRDVIDASTEARELELRREQMYLLAGGAGVLTLVMLLLVPTGRTTATLPPESPAVQVPESLPARQSEPSVVAAAAPQPRFDADAVVELCSDIAAINDSAQIGPLLDRSRALLDARGVIVWLTAPDRAELQAAAASGYDERVIARIGSIAKDESNLTADAFRSNTVKTSSASDTSAAALAIPLPAPGGPAGVFSAELRPGADLEEVQLSAAKLIAAQLGAVLGSASAKSPDEAAASSSTAAVQSSS